MNNVRTPSTLYHGFLDRDTEYELLSKAQQGDRDAANTLIKHNQRLVFSIANKYFYLGRSGGQDIEDLVQWGHIGLYTAIMRFDTSSNNRLSTYATYWIRLYISRYGQKCSVPYEVTYQFLRDCSKVRAVEAELKKLTANDPSCAEIANKAELPVDTVREAIAATACIFSLDEESTGEDSDKSERYELTDDNSEPIEEAVNTAYTRMAIINAVKQLPSRWQIIILQKYGIGCTEKSSREIAKALGISHQRVTQIEKEAMKKLRPLLGKYSDYF